MEEVALLFLGESSARLLASAWRQVPRDVEGEGLLDMWSRLAGVKKASARRLLPVLIGNGIIGQHEDGVRWIDEHAEHVIVEIAKSRTTPKEPASGGT